jgi:hypothetical protein
MTYDELIKWGYAHYNEGGDVFAECWEVEDYNEYIQTIGEMTEEVAKDLAKEYIKIQWRN